MITTLCMNTWQSLVYNNVHVKAHKRAFAQLNWPAVAVMDSIFVVDVCGPRRSESRVRPLSIPVSLVSCSESPATVCVWRRSFCVQSPASGKCRRIAARYPSCGLEVSPGADCAQTWREEAVFDQGLIGQVHRISLSFTVAFVVLHMCLMILCCPTRSGSFCTLPQAGAAFQSPLDALV